MLRVFTFIFIWMLAFFIGGVGLYALATAVVVLSVGRSNESATAILKEIWTALPIVIIPGTLLLGLYGKLPGTRLRGSKSPPKLTPT